MYFEIYNSLVFYLLNRDSIPVPVTKATIEKLEKVKLDLKLDGDESKKISAFTVYGFDILHYGCTKYPTGTIIGIPKNFSYTASIDKEDKRTIAVNNLSNIYIYINIFVTYFMLFCSISRLVNHQYIGVLPMDLR